MHGYRATFTTGKEEEKKKGMRYDDVKQSFCQASSMGSCQGRRGEK